MAASTRTDARRLRRAAVEPLEPRRFCSVTIDAQGVVTVEGTLGPDTITAGVDPNDATKFAFVVNGQATSYARTQVTGLKIYSDPLAGGAHVGGGDFVSVTALFPGVVGINGSPANDTLLGSPGPDVIFGEAGDDSIDGGAGNDTLSGGDGNDTVRGGAGDDVLFGDGGADLLIGGPGNDRLLGGPGNDTLRGGAGNDTCGGAGGNDYATGGPGDDVLRGGAGADTLIGGAGNDTVNGGVGPDVLIGDNDGALVPQGAPAVDTTPGNDRYIGGPGNDTVISAAGADTITAGAGDNLLEVNSSNDSFTDLGGPGTNRATFEDVLSGPPTQTLDVHLVLRIVRNGVTSTIPIPATAGTSPAGTSVARATDGAGDVTFQSATPRTFTLGDFFAHWGVAFNANILGRYTTGGIAPALSMNVNGQPADLFDAYPVRNGDHIAITYNADASGGNS